MNAEQLRLAENKPHPEPWHFWGPYLAERAWGTVREDYSANGDAWNYFAHDHARSRAYRWNEDGIAGISDFKGRLCFAFAFWNERDPFLKERLFGVTGPQGNHGEDVKEVYFYSDATPTHSYMSTLYLLPTIWFRNTWSWGRDERKPNLQERTPSDSNIEIIEATHEDLGTYRLCCERPEKLLFTENESNLARLWGVPNPTPFVKDS